jgi:hypothetical protein
MGREKVDPFYLFFLEPRTILGLAPLETCTTGTAAGKSASATWATGDLQQFFFLKILHKLFRIF